MKRMIFLVGMFALVAAPAFGQAVEVDPKLPEYKPAVGVSGSIKSVGSDTMNNLMTLWSEGFLKFYPSVRVEVEGKGSSTAPTALIAGTATFGPMSREMKSEEENAFEAKYGYKPVGLATSIDMLAVYVNKDNPLKSLSLTQVDAVFSSTRKRGGTDSLTWGQLGLKGEWASAPISANGRNAASGTYGYFKEHVLLKGDYKDSVKEQPGSSAVVQSVASDKFGIGYSGAGYKTADVNMLAMAEKDGATPVEPTAENAYSGDYPLSRPLLLYLNYKPGSQLDPLRREFVKYVFSKQGQQVVIKDGYLPVTAEVAAEELKKLGLE